MSEPPMNRRASGSAIGSSLRRQRLDAHARRRLLLARALLIERRAVDAVREALHDERPIGDGRQDVGGDRRVVAEQIPLVSFERRPEHLRQVGDAEALAAGQLDRAVRPRVLERAQLRRSPARASTDGSPAGASAEGRLVTCSSSRVTTSSARLSSRSPRYTGWRSLPSSVHSVKRTCATRSGRTQCAGSFDLDARPRTASRSISRGLQQLPDARELRLIEPGAGVSDVGQRPSRPFSSCTPSSSAPKYWRVCRGSVQPPTTNSCWLQELQLAPGGAAAAGVIRRPRLLGDEPFPSFVAARGPRAHGRRRPPAR